MESQWGVGIGRSGDEWEFGQRKFAIIYPKNIEDELIGRAIA